MTQKHRHCEAQRAAAIFPVSGDWLKVRTPLAMTQKNRHCEAHSAAAIFPVNGDCFAAARAFALLMGWARLAMTPDKGNLRYTGMELRNGD
jgi:hypothetical protein